MPKSRHLQIWCDALNSEYTLGEVGEKWRRSFHSFDNAFEDAEASIATDTPLTLINERGNVIIETTISPLSTMLVHSVASFAEQDTLPD